MLGKQDLRFAVADPGEFILQHPAHEELLLDPCGNGREEALEAFGGESGIGFEQPLELQVGLVVEGDGRQVAELKPRNNFV